MHPAPGGTPASPRSSGEGWPRRRLASVDALRGCTVAAMLLVNDPGDWGHVYGLLEHAAWDGCTPTDLVFPFFLFLVGVSVALALEPKQEAGVPRAVLLRGAGWRALRIVGLGLAINLLAWWLLPHAHLRLPGVLQRIGLCYAGVAVFALYARQRTQWLAIALLLGGYALLLHAGGTLAPWDNLVSRIDSAVFGPTVYQVDPASGRGHDPEGLAGTLPSLATTLLGLVAGRWLRAGRTAALAVAGLLALAAGLAWSAWQPFNKNLWTPSFALWTAGWAFLALLALHWLIDRHGGPAPGRRFGMNAIAIYAGSELMQILLPAAGWQQPLYERLFAGWITPRAGPYVASLTWALAFVALWWAIAWAMDRRRLYLKL
ncbi:acyltransferase family protein [Fulvimonas yonginensis]|uniref:Heparan-alpha-glucosaminide N-acetyltransferase domain-containing protein n=1 Tax=Fulvimonas yonginensis TaxID=1495200 RepID=A0ABU8JC48_9GAMM